MAVDTEDEVLVQLRKLREGPGLKRDRLIASGAVLSALATSDPEEAMQQLERLISLLDEQDRSVLSVDFGLELEGYLERPASPQEERWLGARRSAYGLVVGRDAKTLARWSDAALLQLRGRLLSDAYFGDLYLVVVVEDRRIARVAMVQDVEKSDRADPEGSDDPGLSQSPMSERRTLEFENPSSEDSPPFFAYAFPREWEPRSLTLAVTFLGDTLPSRVWGVHAPTFIDMSFASSRHELTLVDRTARCTFWEPPRSQLYGVWWA